MTLETIGAHPVSTFSSIKSSKAMSIPIVIPDWIWSSFCRFGGGAISPIDQKSNYTINDFVTTSIHSTKHNENQSVSETRKKKTKRISHTCFNGLTTLLVLLFPFKLLLSAHLGSPFQELLLLQKLLGGVPRQWLSIRTHHGWRSWLPERVVGVAVAIVVVDVLRGRRARVV